MPERPGTNLVAQGWERRFLVDGTRAAEAAQLYRALGFEVRLEPLAPGDQDVPCDACLIASLLRFQTVYTRRPG